MTFFSISTAGSFENSMSRSNTKRKILILQEHSSALENQPTAKWHTHSLNANRYPIHDRFPFTGLPPPNVSMLPHKPCTCFPLPSLSLWLSLHS